MYVNFDRYSSISDIRSIRNVELPEQWNQLMQGGTVETERGSASSRPTEKRRHFETHNSVGVF